MSQTQGGSVDLWICICMDLLIHHWSTDPLIYRSTDMRRASSSLPLPSLSLLKFFFPSALLFRSFRDDSIIGMPVQVSHNPLWLCLSFCWKTGNQYLSSIYQCGGRCIDDVSLSISSSFKETLNRFCASWGKQPLSFIPVALRSNLTVSKPSWIR